MCSPRRADTAGIPAKEEALALVAPAPTVLIGRERQAEEESVVPAARVVVLPARGTNTAWIIAEVHALAFMAPAPAALPGHLGCRDGRIVDDAVVAGAGGVVRTACRAVAARIPGEEQALAFVAPAPV